MVAMALTKSWRVRSATFAHQPVEPAVEAADDDLGVDDVAVLEVALVFAIGGEEVPQRRAIAALGLLPLGGRVLTTGNLPSEITGGLAGGVERDRGPRPDADHTVLAGATA
jgi:hypothetical protein